MTILYLYVDSNDGSLTGWTAVGSSPYLGVIDYPTNIISALNDCRERGIFGYADSLDLGTINTVKAQFYVRAALAMADEGVEAAFKNNASWTPYQFDQPTTSWSWREIDITSLAALSPWTWAKINACVMKVHLSDPSAEKRTIIIDCARLAIDYTPAAAGIPKHYSDGLVCVNWIGLVRKSTSPWHGRKL